MRSGGRQVHMQTEYCINNKQILKKKGICPIIPNMPPPPLSHLASAGTCIDMPTVPPCTLQEPTLTCNTLTHLASANTCSAMPSATRASAETYTYMHSPNLSSTGICNHMLSMIPLPHGPLQCCWLLHSHAQEPLWTLYVPILTGPLAYLASPGS